MLQPKLNNMPIFYAISATIIGFIILIKAADIFCQESIKLATLLKLSPLFIGIALVPIGTSAPELFVSAIAALNNVPLLATGNVLGSNIANIALGFGIAAIITPIAISKSIYKFDLPVLLISSVFFSLFLLDYFLTHTEGILLLLGFASTIVLLIYREKNHTDQHNLPVADSDDKTSRCQLFLRLVIFAAMAGLLYLSSSMVVWGTTQLAQTFGISDLVIGLTIVAIGTSLPEITVTAISAIKGHHDLAMGNIIGSNTFNLLVVLGLTAVIQPHAFPSLVLWRDYLVMLGLSVLLGVFCYYKLTPHAVHLKRWQGSLLIIAYIMYILFILSPYDV